MAEFLLTKQNQKLAYYRLNGEGVGIVYLGGFMSDMEGTKALYLESLCKKLNRPFVRFDYFGHGQSSGAFIEGTIGQWLNDTLTVLENLTEGPQIVIGSSMGGWLMCLAALQVSRIKGLIGIAAAPDFVEDFMRLSPEQHEALERDGICYLPCDYGDKPYAISKKLVEEAREHLLLKGPIAINCPVRLLQGLEDKDVAWEKAIRLSELLETRDVTLSFVKDGDHRLATDANLALLSTTLQLLLASIEEG